MSERKTPIPEGLGASKEEAGKTMEREKITTEDLAKALEAKKEFPEKLEVRARMDQIFSQMDKALADWEANLEEIYSEEERTAIKDHMAMLQGVLEFLKEKFDQGAKPGETFDECCMRDFIATGFLRTKEAKDQFWSNFKRNIVWGAKENDRVVGTQYPEIRAAIERVAFEGARYAIALASRTNSIKAVGLLYEVCIKYGGESFFRLTSGLSLSKEDIRRDFLNRLIRPPEKGEKI